MGQEETTKLMRYTKELQQLKPPLHEGIPAILTVQREVPSRTLRTNGQQLLSVRWRLQSIPCATLSGSFVMSVSYSGVPRHDT